MQKPHMNFKIGMNFYEKNSNVGVSPMKINPIKIVLLVIFLLVFNMYISMSGGYYEFCTLINMVTYSKEQDILICRFKMDGVSDFLIGAVIPESRDSSFSPEDYFYIDKEDMYIKLKFEQEQIIIERKCQEPPKRLDETQVNILINCQE